jgi:hypothetical protein
MEDFDLEEFLRERSLEQDIQNILDGYIEACLEIPGVKVFLKLIKKDKKSKIQECYRCKYFHGITYNKQKLVCTIHPYGHESISKNVYGHQLANNCPDFEVNLQRTGDNENS